MDKVIMLLYIFLSCHNEAFNTTKNRLTTKSLDASETSEKY